MPPGQDAVPDSSPENTPLVGERPKQGGLPVEPPVSTSAGRGACATGVGGWGGFHYNISNSSEGEVEGERLRRGKGDGQASLGGTWKELSWGE